MIEAIKSAINRLNWKYEIRESDTALTAFDITTPFSDKRNDHMEIHITDIDNNSFKLDDDGFIADEFSLRESLFVQSATAQSLAYYLNVELIIYKGRWVLGCGWSRSHSMESRILEFVQAMIVFEALSRLPIDKADEKIRVI